MKYIRIFLSGIILTLDRIIPVKKVRRDAADQTRVKDQCKHMVLYEFKGCPFCVKVSRKIRALNIPIPAVDAKEAVHEAELISGGGKRKVPCLRIQKEGRTVWMYESSDINKFLSQEFS